MNNEIQSWWKIGDSVPSSNDIPVGGFAVDVTHRKAYSKKDNGTVFEIGGSGANVNDISPGIIIMWYGDISYIPSGWDVYASVNGMFVCGAADNEECGSVIGSDDAIVPSHSHSVASAELAPHSHGTRVAVDSSQITGDSGGTSLAVGISSVMTNKYSFTPTGTLSTDGVDGTGKNIPHYRALVYLIKR